MALERAVLMGGAVRAHHEVERITHICGESTVVDVLSWVDAGKSGAPERTILTLPYDDALTEGAAYAHVSGLPGFAEHVDPNAEALEELLPILTDEQAEQVAHLYPAWLPGTAYAAGDRALHMGLLYRCVQAHDAQEGWEPPATPALWARTAPDGEVPEWAQPTGAQDAYAKGDRVTYGGTVWESTVDGNVWAPDAYPEGWRAVEG